MKKSIFSLTLATALILSLGLFMMYGCSSDSGGGDGGTDDGTGNTETFTIADSTGSDFSFSATYDGTNYLIAIRGDASSDTGIIAQFVSASGTLGTTITTGSTGSFPSTAFGSTKHLLAWYNSTDTALYGMMIDKSGSKGARFTITTSLLRDPSIANLAFDGANFLVIWDDERSGIEDIYGQFVSENGTLVGSEIKINTTASAMSSNVAFDGTNHLVVWDNGDDVLGQFVDTSGSLIGTEMTIRTKDLCNYYNPITITYDGANYLMVWHERRTGDCETDWDLYGQLVDTNGNNVGLKIDIATSTNTALMPFTIFDGTKYFVVWNDVNDADSTWEVHGQAVTTSGALDGSEIVLNNDSGNQWPALIHGGGKTLLIINENTVFGEGEQVELTADRITGSFITP